MTALFPHRKDFPDGRFAYVIPLTFGRARIGVARDLTGLDDLW